MLVAHKLSFQIDGKTLLQPMDFALPAGTVIAVLGPNGAGKTTLMSLLSGHYRPSMGKVSLNGRALDGLPSRTLACVRAVLQQDTSVAFDYTVRDVVELGRYPHRLHPSRDEAGIVQAALCACKVAHLQDRILNTLSGGEKARAQLARVLAQIWHAPPDGQSRWLFLDEPTAALDLAHQHQVMALARSWAKEQGIGVVAVLHDLNLALRYADHTLVLQQGRLVAEGTPHSVLDQPTLQSVWGVASSAVIAADGVPQRLVSWVEATPTTA